MGHKKYLVSSDYLMEIVAFCVTVLLYNDKKK